MKTLIQENCKIWNELFAIETLLVAAAKGIRKIHKRCQRRRYMTSEKGRESIHKVNTSIAGRERAKRYNKTKNGKDRVKKYKSRPKVREHIQWMQRSRLSSQRLRDKKL